MTKKIVEGAETRVQQNHLELFDSFDKCSSVWTSTVSNSVAVLLQRRWSGAGAALERRWSGTGAALERRWSGAAAALRQPYMYPHMSLLIFSLDGICRNVKNGSDTHVSPPHQK